MKKTMTILKLVLIVAALLGMPMMSAAQTVAPKGAQERAAGQVYDTQSASSGPRLVIWLKSGGKVVYELAESPKTTFVGSQLVITTVKTTATYERKDVLRYTYENAIYLGIDLQPGERRVQINSEGDQITFHGLQVGSTASVYAVNGTLIEQRMVTDDQPLTISLQNRPYGVYIVKAGTETIKVMKQ